MRILSCFILATMLHASIAFAADCTGAQSINKMAVPKKKALLRTSPSESGAEIVNQKASEALHSTQYAGIDTSTKVMEVCRKGGWSYVELVEPEWLRTTHKGWVPTSTLNVVLTSPAGKRGYRESEVHWDKNTGKHKKEILFAINGFLQDQCMDMDTFSLAQSTTKGTKADPVFFLACNAGKSSARNLFFSKSEIRKKMARK